MCRRRSIPHPVALSTHGVPTLLTFARTWCRHWLRSSRHILQLVLELVRHNLISRTLLPEPRPASSEPQKAKKVAEIRIPEVFLGPKAGKILCILCLIVAINRFRLRED